jgi:hypothetical protein
VREALRCRVVGGVDCRVDVDSNIVPGYSDEKNARMMRIHSRLFTKRKEKKKYMQEISTIHKLQAPISCHITNLARGGKKT